MNINDFAKRELQLVGLLSDDMATNEIGASVMSLINKIDSMCIEDLTVKRMVVNLFWKLINGQNLSPIYNADDDWIPMDESNYKHIRCEDLIKTKSGEFFYQNAIVFVDETGYSWTGWAWLNRDAADKQMQDQRIHSSQKVKSFPFQPKSYQLIVDSVDINGVIEPIIKNQEQLRSIWDTYSW
jgi:hypothetical protein